MPKVAVTFACGLYDRMSALYTGEVKPEGVDLNFLIIDQSLPVNSGDVPWPSPNNIMFYIFTAGGASRWPPARFYRRFAIAVVD